MPKAYQHPKFEYVPPPELTRGETGTATVAVVGGGPVGVCMAIDLARRGVATVLLDDDDTTSHGSRLICMSKRTLEIFDRLGAGQPFRDKGVLWNRGRLFFGEKEVYDFDLLPERDQAWPAFINIQQYYCEDFLIRVAEATDGVELRWRNKVVAVEQDDNAAVLDVETPDGTYKLRADYVIACDGASSTVRRHMDLPFVGRAFQDRFLITDIIMQAEFPSERWFWFEPPFHDGESALLHKQPDDIWRVDLQLDGDADPEVETKPENVIPRIKRMLGEDTPFEVEWISLYTFRCRRLEKFKHGRVIFAGDSAHQVSPFGARGGNGGVQDIDNLAWKLAAVIRGDAPAALIDTYDPERILAADENILNSTRSTDFMTPKSPAVRDFRDAVLALAREHDFARRMVNSGRLSVPAVLDGSSLNTPDADSFDSDMRPGAAPLDAPVVVDGEDAWFLHCLGDDFTAMVYCQDDANLPADFGAAVAAMDDAVKLLTVGPAGAVQDRDGRLAERYDLKPGTLYLFRPDQHVAGRIRRPDAAWLQAATNRAMGRERG